MGNMEIKRYKQLNTEQKEAVTKIFIGGFGHLLKFAKTEQELKQIMSNAFHPSFVYVCMEENKVLGIVGIATNRVRPIKFQLEAYIQLYGKFKGTILCKQMNTIFQSQMVKEDTDLYIDILATAEKERGRGVATKLLKYVLDIKGFHNFWIEVLSKNENAKRLYESFGFQEYKKNRISFITTLGYGYPIKMKQ